MLYTFNFQLISEFGRGAWLPGILTDLSHVQKKSCTLTEMIGI